ncbi:O-methyltransferase [Fusibacter sp. JL216-2]|uniref:O-methyltransferase n=1 Tax=Fusibacter sp. JL216-2 TaxID=3071453 RepID=UPI003D352A93
MKYFINSDSVTDYIRSLLPKHRDEIEALENFATEHNVPIIQPEVGRFIEQLIVMNNVHSVLEIGTAIGFSALVFADAMKSGKVDTIERSELMIGRAKENLKMAPKTVEINLYEGDALELVKEMRGPYDMIFIDAGKGHYKQFLDDCIKQLKPGGLVVSDNVLFKGMIAQPRESVRRRVRTIHGRMRNYLSFLMEHPDLDTSILPLGDGLAISILKSGGADNE